MTGFALKIKTKSGQQIVKDLTPDSTVQDLKEHLSAVSNIPIGKLHVLQGFPPKIFDLSGESKTLTETGLHSGDTLIVEEKVGTSTNASNDSLPAPLNSSTKDKQSEEPTIVDNEARHHIVDSKLDCPGILLKHVVPADNSCLFMSIYFTLNGKTDKTGDVAPWMRQIIAETVARDQDNYSEAILGKPNAEYCKWIKDDKSWGGAIELAVLSQYYGIEIAVVDTINGIINKFGEDQRYAHRVLLLFDGIHYDPLYLEPFSGGEIQTIFPTEDERILKEAEQLASEAKSSRQFTDVNKFTLKCLVCNIMVSGQAQAQQHAQSTGHMNFGEV